MFILFYILIALWLILEIKYVLFWLYLWQLKDYHIARFAEHFSTHKGQKIFFNLNFVLKLILLIFILAKPSFFVYVFPIIFLVYLTESGLFFASVIKKTFKKPKITAKIILLGLFLLTLIILFLIWNSYFLISEQVLWLLVFDIIISIIVGAVVIFFQPFFVAIRNNTLRKATNKIKKIKSAVPLKVIAITGSYGKTSTKEFLWEILSKKYKVLKTKENQNSEIGIAKCILDNLDLSHQIFIVEIGAYNKGKVKEVCSMINPEIGVVTGVNEQHIALFGSLNNLLSAEGGKELAQALPENGTLIVNGDNKYCLDLYKGFNGNKKVYSLNNKTIDSDIWTEEIEVKKDHTFFITMNKNKELGHFKVNVLGKHNIQNILGAVMVAKSLGMSLLEISEACESITQESSGMVLKQGKHGINIIDSSYSANPDGVFADINYLSIFPQKKVIVMPCLIELGKKSAEIHRKIGKKIGKICDIAIITTKDKFKEIKEGAMEAGMSENGILLCDNVKDIFSIITLTCKSKDTVLLEGRVPNELTKLLIN